jgi:two-component system alkaline phosphatase synthesis response regulator PhoP
MTETDKTTARVLVVDDDPDFRDQMVLQLQAAGYDVTPATGQAEAEKLLDKVKPDVAIIDLMMEHVDGGFALCYHIKKRLPDTPVIIVTGVASETGLEFDAATEEERSWVKADALLAKPVRFEQLQREIERLLND